MASIRTWRTAAATMLLVALESTGTPATAGSHTTTDQARYCTQVDAYRIKTCRPVRSAGSSNGCWPNSPARPPP
jgi:hypothetical protein